jgi:chromosome segregation ATPase
MHDQQRSNQSSPTMTPAEQGAAVGDDVMKILEGVEGQIVRLRQAQKVRDDAVASLAQRARAMQQAEDELAARQEELRRQQEKVQSDRQDLENQRRQYSLDRQQADEQARQRQHALERAHEQFKQQHQLLEAQLNTRHGELESRAAELEARAADLNRQQVQLNSERQRIAELENDCQRRAADFARREQQEQEERAELQRRIEQAEANVGDLIKELERANQDAAKKAQQFKDAAAEATTLRQRTGQLESQLAQATQKIEQLRHESAELAKLADQERQEITGKLTSVAAELKETQTTRDALLSETEAARAKAVNLEKSNRALQSQVTDLQTRLSDTQEKLMLAGRKLAEFAQILSEHTPQLERGAAAMALLDQQNEQIERLTKQLAQTKLQSDPEELQRRDQRIAELTEALRQARGQTAGAQGVAEVEQRNAALEKQIDKLRLQLQHAELAAEDAQRQLREHLNSQASDAVQNAAIAEHVAKIASLTAEIENLQSKHAAELKSQLEAQAQRHQEQLAKNQRTGEAESQELRHRISELEQALAVAQQSQATSTDGSNDDLAAYAQKLRARAERVSAVAEHLRRRRNRLQKMRQLLRTQKIVESVPSASIQMRAEEMAKMERERAQVEETRRSLIMAEREMVRKWARPKALTSLACVMFIAVVCAAASWLLADHFAPAKVSASVVLEAKNKSKTPLSVTDAAHWRAWHSDLLSDNIFHSALAQRMAELRFDQYSDPIKLGMRLQNDLTIDTHQDGMMILTLAGVDEDEICTVLDVLATTLASESERANLRQGERPWAAVAGERREGSRIRFASLNPTPIRDVRMTVALPIFAALMFVLLISGLAIYKRLSRAKRVFEEEMAGIV